MAYRCGLCNKFASIEMDEPDVNADVDDEGNVTVDTELTLTSTCCGDQVATASVEGTGEVEIEHEKDCAKHMLSVADTEVNLDDRYDGDAKTPRRYRRHFYQAHVSVTVICDTCEADDVVEITLEEQASGFGSMY